MLKQKLESLFRAQEPVTIFLGGNPDKGEEMTRTGNIIYYSHLGTARMAEALRSSDRIISRSGYTTIMELLSLGCTALIIATPGQTEQEYLASYLKEKGWFLSVSQKNIGTTISTSPKTKFNGKDMMEMSEKLLEEAIRALSEYPEQQGRNAETQKKTKPGFTG
jgi:UDP-N-acetylglucosamine:LPS N-acetylglucosamine transferase